MFDKVFAVKKCLGKALKKFFGLGARGLSLLLGLRGFLFLLLLSVFLFVVHKYYSELLSFFDVHCLGRRNINYIKISYGYKTKGQFM